MGDVLPIVRKPNKILRNGAEELLIKDIAGKKIQKLLRDMKATLAATSDGVGLAAPQVGASLRIFIVSEEAEGIDPQGKKAQSPAPEQARYGAGTKREAREERNNEPKKEWNYYVFINPRVKKTSRKKLEGPEGCLSVPGKYGSVKRNEKITVEAYDETGRKFTRGASRFLARVIQHELDHLDGILFIDKTEELFESQNAVPN